MSPTLNDEKLSSLDQKLVDLLEQYWLIYGKVPGTERLEELGINPEFYKKCMLNRQFRTALIKRGVGIEDLDDPKLTDWALTERQFTAANIMLDLLDNRSRKRKLSDLGISTQEWNSWLRDPSFQNYLSQRSEVMLKDNKHEAHAALLDRVRMGDTNAIKLYYELTGRYIPASARAGAIDPMELIAAVMEIIQEHVRDKETLNIISTKLIGLTAQQAVGHEIDRLQGEVIASELVPKEITA